MLKVPYAILNKWRYSKTNAVNRRILKAALMMGGLTVGVKLLALVKDAVLSASYGTSDALDAFLIAYLLPSFIMSLMANSLGATLVPTYIQVREQEGTGPARQLFAEVLTLSGGILLLVTVVLGLGGPLLLPLLASGFNPAKLGQTQELFYLLLPIVLLNSLASLWTAILNAEERFQLGTLLPAVTSLALIFFLVVFQNSWGIYALVYGTLAGFLLQALLLGWAVKRHGFSLRPAWPKVTGSSSSAGRSTGGRALYQLNNQFWPMLFGSILLGSTGMVDQAIGATLAPGSVSALSYGNKLVAVITGIVTVALATAVLPYFSKMAAVDNWKGLQHTLKVFTYLILAATLPVTLILYINSEWLIALLYQRGAFTKANTVQVAQIQCMYLLQIPVYTLAVFISKLISSLKANQILMWGTLISCILNVAFDIILVQFMGIAGIALSTTIVYTFSFLYLRLKVTSLLKNKGLSSNNVVSVSK
ncbi:MAG: lipid II flippase MurJ [Chloroflexota bacterium]